MKRKNYIEEESTKEAKTEINNENFCLLTSIPSEIIQMILWVLLLSQDYPAIIHLSQTCKLLREETYNDKLWYFVLKNDFEYIKYPIFDKIYIDSEGENRLLKEKGVTKYRKIFPLDAKVHIENTNEHGLFIDSEYFLKDIVLSLCYHFCLNCKKSEEIIETTKPYAFIPCFICRNCLQLDDFKTITRTGIVRKYHIDVNILKNTKYCEYRTNYKIYREKDVVGVIQRLKGSNYIQDLSEKRENQVVKKNKEIENIKQNIIRMFKGDFDLLYKNNSNCISYLKNGKFTIAQLKLISQLIEILMKKSIIIQITKKTKMFIHNENTDVKVCEYLLNESITSHNLIYQIRGNKNFSTEFREFVTQSKLKKPYVKEIGEFWENYWFQKYRDFVESFKF